MTAKHSTWYMVSDAPNRIEPVGEDTPTHYQTPQEAGDAIVNGFHGEAGTRYVLPVQVGPPVATYDRAWSLVRNTRTVIQPKADPFDPEDADLTRWVAENAPADRPRPDPRDVSSGNGTEFS